ncbi:MAG: M48 family metallopeptidase [Acidimicrobiales bacterium]|nr:M48 family metallopeptidase [Acidimicrobiales bacterium]
MYDQVAANKRRSAALIVVFVLFVALVCAAFTYLLQWGPIGIVIAFAIAGGSAFFSYWKSDSIALAMSRAQPATVEQYPRLHNVVEGLCIASGLPKPRLYVIDDPAPNAFATGRNPKHAAIAVTTGLLEKMNRIELEGVLAHELSHIKNDDILVSTLAVTMVGVVALLADIGVRGLLFGGRNRNSNDGGNIVYLALMALALVLLVLSPVIARLMQFAVSRKRESLADISGVEMTRYPPGLISALEKLQADQTVVHSASRATAHLWIESPLARTPEEGKMSKLNRMFDTHPPLEERIAALQEL